MPFPLHLERRIDKRREIIEQEKAKLIPVEQLSNRLDMLRYKHQRYAEMLPLTVGNEMIDALLRLIENEVEQEQVVVDIHKLDPLSNVTATHRVNPNNFRERLEVLVNEQGYVLSAQQKSLISQAKSSLRVLRRR